MICVALLLALSRPQITCYAAATVSGDGKVIAAYTYDKRALIKDLRRPSKTVFLQGVPSEGTSLGYMSGSFSYDGSIYVASLKDHVCVWSTVTGKRLAELVDIHYKHGVVSPDGGYIALTGDRDAIWSWRKGDVRQVETEAVANNSSWHNGFAYFVDWKSYEQSLAFIDAVRPADAKIMSRLKFKVPMLYGLGNAFDRLVISPSGNYAVYNGYRRGYITVINMRTAVLVHTFDRDDVGFFWHGEKLVVFDHWFENGPRGESFERDLNQQLDPATGKLAQYRGASGNGFNLSCFQSERVLYDTTSHRLIGKLPGIFVKPTQAPYHMPGP